jgi:hypothetical protein
MKSRSIHDKPRANTSAPAPRAPFTAQPEVVTKVAELLQALGQQSTTLFGPQVLPAEDVHAVREQLSAQEITDALLDRLIRRMPKGGRGDQPGEVCPYTGLNRSALYELINKRENGKPAIRSVTLREAGEKHGARFYYVGSVLRYLDQLAERQESEEPSVPEPTIQTKKHGKHSSRFA